MIIISPLYQACFYWTAEPIPQRESWSLAPELKAHAVQEMASLVCFPLSHTLAGVPSAQSGRERALHSGGEDFDFEPPSPADVALVLVFYFLSL